MLRYKFCNDLYELTNEGHKLIEKRNMILYKCLICGYTHDFDETWSDTKKAEVQAEVDQHHNEHFIT